MAYARVVNIEYKVPERLEAAIKNWTEEGFKSFPPALSRVAIRTGPNSTMLIAIYETEEKAEEARQIAENLSGKHDALHEVIDFHGEVIHQE